MPSKKKDMSRQVTFSEYRDLKNEIIEISEHRYENILTNRLKEFRISLMDELNIRFDAIETKFESRFDGIDAKFDGIDAKFNANDSKFNALDSRFDSIERRLTFLTWFLPVFLTIVMIILKFYQS